MPDGEPGSVAAAHFFEPEELPLRADFEFRSETHRSNPAADAMTFTAVGLAYETATGTRSAQA